MRLSLFLPCFLLFCQPALAKDAPGTGLPAGATIETDPKYPPVVSYTLKNGLKLLILEKKFVPIVSFGMTFRVGNVDCPPGKTGLAHVFEHMAFKGTETMNTKDFQKEKVFLADVEKTAKQLIAEESLGDKADPKKVVVLKKQVSELEKSAEAYSVTGEFFNTYEKLGSHGLNAATSVDYTVYQISLPADRLEAWMIMEGDRFKHPVLREFYKERSVIMEERRMGEANPGNVIFESLSATAFAAHPYRNPVVGWMDDLKKLSRTDAEEFYAKYYVPNNATLAIVGDARPAEVIRLAEKYFAGWQGKELPGTAYTQEPEQKAEKRVNLFFKAKPSFYMGFHNPGETSPDTPALIMLSEVLSGGKTGRFYRNLVEGRQLALYADSGHALPGSRYPSLFLIAAAPKAPHTNEEVEAAVWEELETIKKAPPTAWELEKILNNYEADMVRSLEGNLEFAKSLSQNDRIMGDWKYNWTLLEALKKVTPADVSRVAEKYLTRPNYTIVLLTQEKAAPAPAQAGLKGAASK